MRRPRRNVATDSGVLTMDKNQSKRLARFTPDDRRSATGFPAVGQPQGGMLVAPANSCPGIEGSDVTSVYAVLVASVAGHHPDTLGVARTIEGGCRTAGT